RLEEPLLLLLRPPLHEHLGRERVVHAHEHGGRCIHDRDLLERDEICERVEAEPIELLRHHHAEEPELAQLLDQRRLEMRRAVPLIRERRDLARGELASRLLDRFLFFSEWSERPSHKDRWSGGAVERCATALPLYRSVVVKPSTGLLPEPASRNVLP